MQSLPRAIQSRYRSHAAAPSCAIRQVLAVMLSSGRKGRQGTCSHQVMRSPWTPWGSCSLPVLLVLWLWQGEAQPHHWDMGLRGVLPPSPCRGGGCSWGGLADGRCTGVGGAAGAPSPTSLSLGKAPEAALLTMKDALSRLWGCLQMSRAATRIPSSSRTRAAPQPARWALRQGSAAPLSPLTAPSSAAAGIRINALRAAPCSDKGRGRGGS